MRFHVLSGCGVAATVTFAAHAGGGALYQLVDLGLDGSVVYANAINDSGLVLAVQENEIVVVDGSKIMPVALGLGNDINNTGQICGDQQGVSSGEAAAVWTPMPDGTYEVQALILPEGASANSASRLNDTGNVAGFYQAPGGKIGSQLRPVLWSDDDFQELGTIGEYTINMPRDINSSNVVVGNTSPISLIVTGLGEGVLVFPWMWDSDSGLLQLPTPPGGTSTSVFAINDVGVIAGATTLISGDVVGHALVLWKGGQVAEVETVPFPFAVGATVGAINDKGVVVGTTILNAFPIFVAESWVYRDGEMFVLSEVTEGVDSWSLEFATDVNESGVIVGYGTLDGQPRAFKLLPACAEDLDDDGSVGFSDLLTLLAAWNSADADLDGDGTTGFSDLLVLLSSWGSCS